MLLGFSWERSNRSNEIQVPRKRNLFVHADSHLRYFNLKLQTKSEKPHTLCKCIRKWRLIKNVAKRILLNKQDEEEEAGAEGSAIMAAPK